MLLALSLIYTLIVLSIGFKPIVDINTNELVGVITSFDIKDDKISFILNSDDKIKCNYYYKTEKEKKYFIENIKLGTKIKVTGELYIPNENTIPNNFNYKRYLYYNDIFYLCKVKSLTITSKKISGFYKFKNYVINRISKLNNKEYLFAFILGNKDYLDSNEISNYKKNGIMHLFAISGMHIGLFSVLISSCLKKMGIKENLRYVIAIIFIWLYALLTGFSASVLRASLLFTLISLNKIYYTEVKTINIVILTGALLLFFSPRIIMNIGFLYSYACTFGLVYSYSFIEKHKTLGSSLIASIFSLPITVNNFYEFNIFSIILNLFFIPLVSLVVYPMCLIVFIFPWVEPILNVVITILEYTNELASNLYIFKIVLPKMNFIFILIYYLILLLYINKNSKKCFAYIVLVLFINILFTKINASYNVTFFDVGQGDSTLIKTPFNKNSILIDTGGNISDYNISSNIITYLNSIGIYKLNYLVLSHGDFDHMGEAINLVNNFKIEKVIFNCGPYNDLEKDLIKVLDKKKIKYYSCIKELNVDKNKMYFLQKKEYDNENDNSNVIYTELNGYKFMFMGDASVTTEKEILNNYNLPNIDVLKVGHHGSRTSSSKEFIDEINPKYSIISVGKNNRYGHPNKEVLNNLYNSKIYRTDEDGSIMFKIKNNKIKIETCSP